MKKSALVSAGPSACTTLTRPLLLIAAVLGLLASGSAAAQAAACNRACLMTLLDGYLQALVTHDASRAPISKGFRQTENSSVVPLGEGLWLTSTALGEVRRRFFDPLNGSAAYWGLIKEGEVRAVVSLRVLVEDRKITEAEWIIARPSHDSVDGTPGKVIIDIDHLIRNPPPERVVPQKERASREELLESVNSYFDGIANRNARIFRAHPGCARFENGVLVGGRPLPPERRDDGGLNGLSDCRSGTSTFDVAQVAARRFHVVDEEAQVVMASAVFIRMPGDHGKRRNQFMNIFVLEGGLMRSLYAAIFYAPPTQPVPNWPPYDGNFPVFGLTR